MSSLTDLYQELIVDHSKHPRNFGALAQATHEGDGYNPLCGDKLKLYLQLEGERVTHAMFEGSGCAISTASASLLTESVLGKTKDECLQMFHNMQMLLKGDTSKTDALPPKLAAFSGVAKYPARVKCAVLSWHVLQNVLQGKRSVAKTE